MLGQAVALGMTECEVVYRAGTPASVQLGSNPNGDRVAVLTYGAGPRPGLYRFERGRLMDMDSVRSLRPRAESGQARGQEEESAGKAGATNLHGMTAGVSASPLLPRTWRQTSR